MGYTVPFCLGVVGDPAHCLGVPVLVGDHWLAQLYQQGYRQAFVAVGHNPLRQRLATQVQALGFQLVNALSPRATLSPSAQLGVGVAVMAGAVINAQSVLQDLVIVNTGATVDHDCVVEVASHLAPQVALAGNVQIGAGSFLGVGSRVIPGIQIGAGVVIGAGAVVVRSIPPGVTAYGVPARVRGEGV